LHPITKPFLFLVSLLSETGQVVTNYWKAVIGYKFNRQKIRVDDIIQNPLGIEIIDYEIIKRNIMK
jgi:type IV secretory pathway component VirB8